MPLRPLPFMSEGITSWKGSKPRKGIDTSRVGAMRGRSVVVARAANLARGLIPVVEAEESERHVERCKGPKPRKGIEKT